jgi:hypothetical protein
MRHGLAASEMGFSAAADQLSVDELLALAAAAGGQGGEHRR